MNKVTWRAKSQTQNFLIKLFISGAYSFKERSESSELLNFLKLPKFGWTVPTREVNTLAAAVQAGHTPHTQPCTRFHQQMSSLLLSTNNSYKYLLVDLAFKTTRRRIFVQRNLVVNYRRFLLITIVTYRFKFDVNFFPLFDHFWS